MTKELLNKYLNNNCTKSEFNEVLLWVKTNALSDEGKQLVIDDWENYKESSNLKDDSKFIALFDKIQKKIDFQNDLSAENKSIFLFSAERWFTKAAAILLIPVLIFLFYTLFEKKTESIKYANMTVDSLEIVAPVGSRTIVSLKDGSKVYLNYGSKLKFPYFFLGDTRDVKLTGEGFFEVAHNPKKPFIVKTGKINIKAVGTMFNVLAYSDDDKIETTLVRGKVILEQNDSKGKLKIIGSMKPGQHVSCNKKNGNVLYNSGNVEKYVAWKEGKQIFEDTPILEVTKRLSRMFNVDIHVANDVMGNVYSFTFIDESLSQILDLMTIATPIRYIIKPRENLQDGTYTKQRIFIEKRK